MTRWRVQIVDDDRIARGMLIADLEGESYECSEATSAAEMFAQIEQSPPDLILLSMRLPDIDGVDACYRLKRDPETEHIPIIATTSLDRVDHVVRIFDAGAVDYLAKPYRGPVVRARVRLALQHAHAIDELAAARRHADETTRAKTEFLANMSHEIRTSLNSILGFSRLLLGEELVDDVRRKIAYIHEGGETLLDLINDILDLSKVEAGKYSLNPVEFDLEPLVESVVSFSRVLATEKGLAVKQSVDPSVPRRLVGDRDHLRQILANLLSNAIKFTAEGSVSLHVAADPLEPRNVRFEVVDTGIGIPLDQQATIFDPFARVERSGRNVKGTGLGLAICRQLAVLLGGQIGVESEPGGHSCFWVSVPLAPATHSTREANAIPDAATSVAGPPLRADGGMPRCLVVEDDEHCGVLVEAVLRDYCNVDVLTCGGEAVSAIERGEYDVVLLDLDLPDIDGLELARLIRQRELISGGHTPIITVTAAAMEADRQRCLEAGADDHVTKPFNIKVLVQSVCNQLEGADRAMSDC